MDNFKTLKDFVVKNLNLPCEQIGTWIWVGPVNNRVLEETLLKQGFLYSKSRNLYYYREPLTPKYKVYTMDELRSKYNSMEQLQTSLVK